MSQKPTLKELQLARRIVRVLKTKARAGVMPTPFYPDPTKWEGHGNGYGTEVGKDIDALVAYAERLLAKGK